MFVLRMNNVRIRIKTFNFVLLVYFNIQGFALVWHSNIAFCFSKISGSIIACAVLHNNKETKNND